MFLSKKDKEIKELNSAIEILKADNVHLQSRIQSEEKFRIKVMSEADKEHIEFLMFKEEVMSKDESYKIEIARLRGIVTREKRKRINSACANRRRTHGRSKELN